MYREWGVGFQGSEHTSLFPWNVCNTDYVTKTYIAVVVVQTIVIVALWLLSRHFA